MLPLCPLFRRKAKKGLVYHPILRDVEKRVGVLDPLSTAVDPCRALRDLDRAQASQASIQYADLSHWKWAKQSLENGEAIRPLLSKEGNVVQKTDIMDEDLWQTINQGQQQRQPNILEAQRQKFDKACEEINTDIGLSQWLRCSTNIPIGKLIAGAQEMRKATNELRSMFAKEYAKGKVCKWMIKQKISNNAQTWYLGSQPVKTDVSKETLKELFESLTGMLVNGTWVNDISLRTGILVFEAEKPNAKDAASLGPISKLVGSITFYVWVNVTGNASYGGYGGAAPQQAEDAPPMMALMPYVVIYDVPYVFIAPDITEMNCRTTSHNYILSIAHSTMVNVNGQQVRKTTTEMHTTMYGWPKVQQVNIAHFLNADSKIGEISQASWNTNLSLSDTIYASATRGEETDTTRTASNTTNHLSATVPQMLFLNASIRTETINGSIFAVDKGFGGGTIVEVEPAIPNQVPYKTHGLGRVNTEGRHPRIDGIKLCIGIWSETEPLTIKCSWPLKPYLFDKGYIPVGDKFAAKLKANSRTYLWA